MAGTVQRSLADQHDDRKDLSAVKADVGRWKLYMRVAAVLLTPPYLVVLAVVVKAAQVALGL